MTLLTNELNIALLRGSTQSAIVNYIFEHQADGCDRVDYRDVASDLGIARNTVKYNVDLLADKNILILSEFGIQINPQFIKTTP